MDLLQRVEFASNYFIFLENLFQVRNLLIWCTNYLNVHIRIFRKRWSLILGCFFPVSILKQVKLIELISHYLGVGGENQRDNGVTWPFLPCF